MAETEPEQVEAGKKGGSGLFTGLAAALVAGAGAFAFVWYSAAEPEPCEVMEAKPAAAADRYVALEPMVVALSPEAGAQILRIEIALGLAGKGADLSTSDVLRLRDRWLDALRTVDTGMITDPERMPALRTELLTLSRSVLGEAVVAEILITEFMMS
jgi:flagellar basal body-associated protein FliL